MLDHPCVRLASSVGRASEGNPRVVGSSPTWDWLYISNQKALAQHGIYIYIYIYFYSWKHFDIYFSLIDSFDAPGIAYKRIKKLTSFNNTTLNNKRIQKALAYWMVRILFPFDFQKTDCAKVHEAISHCLYGCITCYWVWVKQFSISDIASNRKFRFKNLLTSWMFRESLSFVGACIIDSFDMN